MRMQVRKIRRNARCKGIGGICRHFKDGIMPKGTLTLEIQVGANFSQFFCESHAKLLTKELEPKIKRIEEEFKNMRA